MDEPGLTSQEQALHRLSEMVLDHLAEPRAGTSGHVQELQDRFMPMFIDLARYAWLAASPYHWRLG